MHAALEELLPEPHPRSEMWLTSTFPDGSNDPDAGLCSAGYQVCVSELLTDLWGNDGACQATACKPAACTAKAQLGQFAVRYIGTQYCSICLQEVAV